MQFLLSPLAVQRQICLITFVIVHTGYIVQNAFVPYNVPCGYISAVIDLKQAFFVNLFRVGAGICQGRPLDAKLNEVFGEVKPFPQKRFLKKERRTAGGRMLLLLCAIRYLFPKKLYAVCPWKARRIVRQAYRL